MKKKCENCGKEFNADKNIRKYCSQKCYGEIKSNTLAGKKPKYMEGFKKGNIPANKGKKAEPNRTCPECNSEFHTKPSHNQTFCSKECNYKDKEKPNKLMKKVRQDIRRLPKYRKWREAVLDRHKRCIKCGSQESLDIDHFPKTLNALIASNNIKQSRESNDIKEFWDVNNGRVLCKKCHHGTITSKNTIYSIRNSSVCVTGGAGMIGSHLIDELLSRGNKVLVLDSLVCGEKRFISDKAKFVWFDIRNDQSKLTKLLIENGIDFVFHLVSFPFIPNCFADPIPFFETNAGGTMNVLVSCQEANVKKVLVYSSAEIYGTKEEPIKETDMLNPQSTYGVAKIAADHLARIRYVEADMPVVINRQFNVYSWRARHPYIIPEIVSQLSKSNTIHLGNIYAYRDFLFIDDAVNMAIELLEKGIPGEEYNVGAEECHQIKDIVSIVAKLMGKEKVKIVVDKKRLRPWDITRLQADTTKLNNTIVYRPKYNIEKGLQIVIDKFKENGNKWDY